MCQERRAERRWHSPSPSRGHIHWKAYPSVEMYCLEAPRRAAAEVSRVHGSSADGREIKEHLNRTACHPGEQPGFKWRDGGRGNCLSKTNRRKMSYMVIMYKTGDEKGTLEGDWGSGEGVKLSCKRANVCQIQISSIGLPVKLTAKASSIYHLALIRSSSSWVSTCNSSL